MAGSTWTWIGGNINLASPSDWASESGPGNPTGIPEAGDTAINTGTLVGLGVIAASLINSGTVEASNNSAPGSSTGGELEIQGSVSGTGSMTIAPGATLAIDGSLGAGQAIAFRAGAPETLILGAPTGTIANAITGLAEADKIEFSNGITLNSVGVSNTNTLVVFYHVANGATGVYDLTDVTFSGPTGITTGTDPITNDPYLVPERFALWNGGSGNFGTATNWNIGSVPGPLDYAAFNLTSGGTISGTGSVNELQFYGNGAWTLAPGTSFSDNLYLSVGTGGGNAGNLTIGSGSTVVSGGEIYVASSAGSDATLTISGGGVLRQNGAATSLNYEMFVGGAGSATLGAGTGSVLVTGAGSLLDMGVNGLSLANSGGSGNLTVSQGGSVQAETVNSNLNNAIAIGRLGNGTLTVTDPGSRVTATGIAYVAHTGSSALLVENSGTFLTAADPVGMAGLTIGDGSTIGVGGVGVATVSTGGNLISQGYVTVGLRGTSGQLTVLNGGIVKVGTTLTVGDGGTLAPGVIESGSGTLSIGAGGTVELTGAAQTASYGATFGTSNDGTASTENAVATVSGAGALLDTSGDGIATGLYGSAILTVSQGGKVVSGTANSSIIAALSIGRQGAGTVVVNGGTFLANGEVYVGRAGTGDLLIENNGSLQVGLDGTGSTTDAALQIGGAGYSSGTLLYVGGFGSMEVERGGIVSSQLNVDVGRDGTNGSLSINQGVVETSQLIHIGNSTTAAAGDMIITTAGTTTTAVPTLEAGNGSVDIGPGGTLASTSAVLTAASGLSSIAIGASAGVMASVTVHGTGALLSAGDNRLSVGAFGQGNLTISQGGSVESESSSAGNEAMYIGGSEGAIGAVTVTDPGSTLTALGQLDVGLGGSGNLLIANQASVFTGRDTKDPAQGLDIGQLASASGAVTVTGPHSVLSNTGRFVVGDAGLGSLSIQSGGTVITTPGAVAGLAGAVIAATATASGSSATVTGPGSTFQVTGALTVGASGSGSLSITNGASVTAATLTAGVQTNSSGVITVTGPNAALTTTGDLSIGGAGAGELAILNGANVFIGGSLNIGQTQGGSGNADIEDTTGTIFIGGDLNIGAGGPGALTIGPNTVVELDNGGVNLGANGSLIQFSPIDPPTHLTVPVGRSNAFTFNGTQTYLAYVDNLGDIPIGAGLTFALDTPIVYGSGGAFSIGAGTDLVLNADTVTGQTFGFASNTGTLTLGIDTQQTIDIPSTGSVFTSEANPNFGTPLIGGFHGTIANYAAGDTIAITTQGAATFSQSGTTIAVIQNGATVGVLGFDTAAAAQAAFVAPGALVDNVLCFLAGTLIGTPDGQVEVERLSPGDRVRTAGGAVRPVAWIGHGRVLATRGRRGPATPVIVRKGALGPNVPHTDLHVTKGHALWFDGVLIPVEFLVNHRSILWDDRAQEVSVYHVELETHDVLIANGAAAESYRDDGNRWLFQNGNTGWDQPAKAACAPVLTGGPVVDAVWRRLLDLCGPRPGVPLTGDPDLCLMVDGVRVAASAQAGDVYVFRLSGRPGSVRLRSRAAAPQEIGVASDPRCLGVAVRRVVVRQGTRFRVVRADDARLDEGFHAFEPADGVRWTDGDAVVPGGVFDGFVGTVEVVVHLGGVATYVDDGAWEKVA